MNPLNWFMERAKRWADREAIRIDRRGYAYGELLTIWDKWTERLREAGVGPGEVVSLEGDFSPETCGALLALIGNGNLVVPLAAGIAVQREERLELAEAGRSIRFFGSEWHLEGSRREARHELLRRLASSGRPGLVLFSSGSTGKPKGIVHDWTKLLEKYKVPRESIRTLSFLLFDHIGGLNTLFHTLSNGGTIVAARSRKPSDICGIIEEERVELLPTTPSFLNLLLMTNWRERYDLSSLRVVTFGTEVMSEHTLAKLQSVLPSVQFRQTYGLSELGILRVKSKPGGSLWMKVGGEGVSTAVKDGLLHIKSESAMEGYLNAPNPFDDEGWFNTQDEVDTDGEYIRILGRRSDLINVGGQKVYPAEVENVLLQLPQIRDVLVTGRPHPLLGNVVQAVVNAGEEWNARELKTLIRRHCQGKLEAYQIPVYVTVRESELHSERFKKIRNATR